MKSISKTQVWLRARQKGLTLIEAAMVLGIAALVIAGVLVLYSNASTSNQTSTAITQLNTVQQAIRSVYGGQSVFTGLGPKVLIDAQAVPSGMVTSGTTMANSFNGAIDVAAVTTSVTDDSFTVSFGNIPPAACVQMVTKDYGRSMTQISIGTSPVTATSANGLPSVSDASTACGKVSATIVWTFSN